MGDPLAKRCKAPPVSGGVLVLTVLDASGKLLASQSAVAFRDVKLPGGS
jgi:hypothetical protein